MKKLAITIASIVLTVQAWALPSFEPFSNATSSGGTGYLPDQNATRPPFSQASALDGQVNALGERWLRLVSTTGTSSTNSFITCVSSNLNYTNFPAGFPTSPNAVLVPGSTEFPIPHGTIYGTNGVCASLKLSQDVLPSGVSGITNRVYASFLMRVPSLGKLSTTQIFFGGFWTNSVGVTNTSLPPVNVTAGRTMKMYLAGNSATAGSSTTYKVGVGDSVNGNQRFDGGGHGASDVLFVVVDYEMGPGASDVDVINMWINPANTSFGAAAQPTPTITTNTVTVTNRCTDISSFFLATRDGASVWGDLLVSNLRIGRSWSYVTGGPEIGTQPASTATGPGETTTFQIQAFSGSTNNALTYRWQKGGSNLSDGGDISGSSTPTLTIANGSPSSAGTYTVVVSNLFGTTVSSNAVLSFEDPHITSQPPAVLNIVSGSANISVTAIGTPTLTYQWTKDNNPLGDGATGTGSTISGSTTSHLTIANVGLDDSGTYAVTVVNGASSSIVSSNCILTVNNPAIVSSPQNVTTNFKGSASFFVSAAGTAPLTYQWQFNGGDLSDGPSPSGLGVISGSHSTNLVITSLAYGDSGSYSAVVRNGLGSTTSSSAATLTVIDPILTNQPVSRTNIAGSTATFTVGAIGTSPIGYVWRKNGVNMADNGTTISGSATSSLTIANVSDADVGSYSVLVTGIGSQTNGGPQTNIISSLATLTVQNPVTVTNSPVARVERVGDNMAFSIGIRATAPSFQWKFNGTDIAGATTSSLVLSNIQLTNAGNYTVVVSNQLNAITNSATLTVTNGLLPLTAANLVVARVGSGAEPLNTTNGNTLYLDQFTPVGGYVSTIMIPNSGTSALIVEGGGAAGLVESVVTRSANQEFLNFAGYNLSLPNTNTTFTGSTPVRGIGAVSAFGYYSLCLTNGGLYSGGEQVRSAVSTDGLINFWTTGSGNGGIKYLTPNQGSGGIPMIIGGAGTDYRVVDIFNGNLWFSSSIGSGQIGVFKFPGIPFTTNSPDAGYTFPSSGSPTDFAFSPDGQTVYIADANLIANGGGIQRWDNGSFSYTLATGNNSTVGARGLTVDFSNFVGGVGAVIYATTAESSDNHLISITDNGSGSTATVLGNAGPNQLFRGIRFSPIAAALTIETPLPTESTIVGHQTNFTAGIVGSTPISYQWQLNGTNIVGATQSSLVFTNPQLADVGTYSVIASNPISVVTNLNGVLQVAPFQPEANLAAWLTLNDGTGSTAADASGNGNNGTLTDFPGDDSQWVSSGRIGGALKFANVNGLSNNVMAIADSPSVNFDSGLVFSISLWVRSMTNNQISSAGIIAKGAGTGGEQYAIDLNGANLRFFVRKTATNAVNLNTTTQLNQRWQHIVAAFDGTKGIMKLYVDGQLAGSAAAPNVLISSTHEVSIGNRQLSANSAYNLPFIGLIDDVRIYNVLLEASDVQTIYSSAPAFAPLFYTQPQNVTTYAGDTVTFSAAADASSPAAYQWKKNNANIPGATASTLTLTNLHLPDAGNYVLRVTNVVGTAVSSNAVLQVLPISISNVTLQGDGTIQVSGAGKPNSSYHVLTTTNLALPISQWTVLSSGTFNSSGQLSISDSTTNKGRFYLISIP